MTWTAGKSEVNQVDNELAFRLSDEEQTARQFMAKKPVFVSFDFDNDRALKDFIIGQSKLADSPFDVVDNSLKEAAPEKDWLDKARSAISRSEVFMIMLGPKTRTGPGVLKELKIRERHSSGAGLCRAETRAVSLGANPGSRHNASAGIADQQHVLLLGNVFAPQQLPHQRFVEC